MIRFLYRTRVGIDSFYKSFKDIKDHRFIVDTEHYKEVHATNFNGAPSEFIWASGAYDVVYLDGMCPTQAEGTIQGGRAFYFRARGSQWTLDVSNEIARPDYGTWFENSTEIAKGQDPTGGAMGPNDVHLILSEEIAKIVDLNNCL